MESKNKSDGQKRSSFIEAARRAQIIECTIEAIASLGMAQASLAQIAARAGISKGVISYYFGSKDALIDQVVAEIYEAAVQVVEPQVAAQPTVRLMLQVYISAAVEYIGTHRTQMMALIEIATNYCTKDGQPLFTAETEEPILVALDALLHKGQQEGDFRPFDLRVMAVTIRRAIDAVPPLLAANPDLDVKAYARELATLFDRATCKE
jgi:TetR/AcrR family fatty acid metabolism transcriptional regulator